ncbi:topology modulation protein [Bacillus suaedaesalsae]|uniref:Topology modulation protein n=1 Tax=Bacillus suaedaesalsae TaxID=2810349 RepID=A0ABS2DFE9_9BACI|nr:topology modulation protein [Bacillus suaedaesalsae]MBM6617172.1 topology modulation protein [Bacillus suaedaesalsae]
MNRVMVIGISSGVGKTTFARKLGEKLGYPVTHLDSLYWKTGWIESEKGEFEQKQREVVQKDQWIIEGNYNSTFHIRAEHADTIIYLELPLYVCLYRVVSRWFSNIGSTRPDMPEGCPEKLDWPFIKFIYTTYYPRKQKMAKRFEKFGKDKTIITLKSKQEIAFYLSNFS